MKLDDAAAHSAVREFARKFDFGVEEMAQGILGVINSKMANAIRTMTISKGIDPREFSLIAFGGAGPMHAMLIAEELEIGKVIVPNVAGQFSAWGMLNADIRHDMSVPVNARLKRLDWNAVQSGFASMQEKLAALLRDEGVPAERMRFLRYLEMRYISQEYTLSVPVLDDAKLDTSEAEAFKARFDDLYLHNYGHTNPQEESQVANIRVEARGLNDLKRQDQRSLQTGKAEAAADMIRPVVFAGKKVDTRFIDRARLKQGDKLTGPLIIVELSCTTVVPPGWAVELDFMGNLLIQRIEESKA
jgi:N-methylhydantoinase A